MTAQTDIRKLVAILYADVKDYSRMMGEDDSLTVLSLTRRRKLFQEALEIEPHFIRAYTGILQSYFNEWSCQLTERLPQLNVFGGCCRTDHHHINEIALALG